LGGHHISKGEALDGTLPEELKQPAKLRHISDGIVLNDTSPVTSRIQLFRIGTFYHPHYGKFTITEDTIKNMIRNFNVSRPQSPTEMVVDYDHLSIENNEPMAGRAAGWVKAVSDGGALFASVEWTNEAAEFIRNKQFRFISPEWHMNYPDKESTKTLGPTLISVALTNRPFIEGMQPVVLSDDLAGTFILSENVINDLNLMNAAEKAADWDTQYINNLPDNCFAYIRSGGEKDADGKTVPRSLRFLPYKGEDEKVDRPHLQSAFQRLPQEDLSPEERTKAQAALAKVAHEAGVGEHGEGGEEKAKEAILDKELRELLGIGDGGNIIDSVRALKAKAEVQVPGTTEVQAMRDNLTAETQRANDLQAEKDTQERETIVAKAITDKKLLPKMKDWALAYVAKDKEGFTTYLETATITGPVTGVLGKDTGNENITLTEHEISIAAKMGVSREKLLEQKLADQTLQG